MVTLKCACGLQPMVTCMCCNGSKTMELLGTVMLAISCAEEGGYDYVVEWTRENGCPES
jgi:hypothetical protein